MKVKWKRVKWIKWNSKVHGGPFGHLFSSCSSLGSDSSSSSLSSSSSDASDSETDN